jgi:hypothetical protein
MHPETDQANHRKNSMAAMRNRAITRSEELYFMPTPDASTAA